MKIKHVEELVGITSKNIRFYEEQGLLTPDRAGNGYREYGQKDIERLMQIKLLRKIGVSIEEIGRLLRGEQQLSDCMDGQLTLLEQQKKTLTNMQQPG